MKKLILIIVCVGISNIKAYTWTINNKTKESLVVTVQAKLPVLESKSSAYGASIKPNSVGQISTGARCGVEVDIQGSLSHSAVWKPEDNVPYQCGGPTIVVEPAATGTGFKLTTTYDWL